MILYKGFKWSTNKHGTLVGICTLIQTSRTARYTFYDLMCKKDNHVTKIDRYISAIHALKAARDLQ